MNKRGISAIVATVLIILVTVAGVTIVWAAIIPLIQQSFEFSELEGRVSVVSSGGYTSYDADKKLAMVQVKRDVDDEVMESIKILFSVNGSSFGSSVPAPESGLTKVYTFDLSDYGEPDSVKVVPIFVVGNTEKEGSVTSDVRMSKGVISEVADIVYELENDYSYEIPITGLVGWWKFDGNANDYSGEGNDGICPGTTCPIMNLTGGKYGGAFEFDGVNDKIITGVTRPTNNFTFGGWMKTSVTHQIDSQSTSGTGGTSWQKYAFGASQEGSNGGVGLSVGTNGISVYEHGNNYMPALAVYSSSIGTEWNHIVIVYNNKQPTIYLNGVAVHTGLTSVKTIVYAPYEIGGGDYGYFDGFIDEVQIYNRSLSSSEIDDIFTRGY